MRRVPAYLVVTVLRSRLGGDRGEALCYAVRRMPRRLRRPLARTLAWAPLVPAAGRALARWELGDVAGAAAVLRAGRPPCRRLRLHISVALAMEDSPLAADLLARLPAEDPARPRLTALLRWRDGEYGAAVALLDATPGTGPEGRRSAALLARLKAELAVLEPTWRAATRPPTRASPPVPNRVLHVLTNSLPGTTAGYTIRSHLALTAQRDAGLDPHAVTRLGYPVTAGVLRPSPVDVVDGIPYYRLLPARGLPRRADHALALGVELAGVLVESLRPAVLHATTNYVNGQVALALRERYGLPVVYEVRGFLEESWLSRRRADRADSDRYRRSRAMETYCMRQADLVVTLGEVMKAEIVARGVPAERVLVVPNAVDARFLGDPPDPGSVRRRLHVRPGEWVVGLVSTFAAHEGIGTLVRAVALLRSAGLPLRLLLVGDGPEAPALRRLAADLGIADAVVMPGWVPHAEIREWYAALDVFVVPRIDARVSHLVTPLKPVEAMALGRPVVASDVGGLAEIVSTATGVLVPPEHPIRMAEAIEGLLRDEPARLAMGAAARDWVAEERTWAHNAARYRAAYAELVAIRR